MHRCQIDKRAMLDKNITYPLSTRKWEDHTVSLTKYITYVCIFGHVAFLILFLVIGTIQPWPNTSVSILQLLYYLSFFTVRPEA